MKYIDFSPTSNFLAALRKTNCFSYIFNMNQKLLNIISVFFSINRITFSMFFGIFITGKNNENEIYPPLPSIDKDDKLIIFFIGFNAYTLICNHTMFKDINFFPYPCDVNSGYLVGRVRTEVQFLMFTQHNDIISARPLVISVC